MEKNKELIKNTTALEKYLGQRIDVSMYKVEKIKSNY